MKPRTFTSLLVILSLLCSSALSARAAFLLHLEKEVPARQIPASTRPVRIHIFESSDGADPASSQTFPLGAIDVSRIFTVTGAAMYRIACTFSETASLAAGRELWWALEIGGVTVGRRERVPRSATAIFASEANRVAATDSASAASEADTLQGMHGHEFAAAGHTHLTDTFPDGPGSLLDTDQLDGRHASDLAAANHAHSGVEVLGGSGSLLDADRLDGLHGSWLALSNHTHDSTYSDMAYVDALEARVDALEVNGGQRPTANAGTDITGAIGVPVTLDGSASSDPEGQPLTFTWTMRSLPPGSSAQLADATTAGPSFVPDLPGDYTVDLRVSDGYYVSLIDTIVVTATGNVPPVADAGADQSVVASPLTIVTLDGSGSDDYNGDLLTYAWVMVSTPDGSAASLSDPSAVDPTFTADLEGSYIIELSVHDGTVPGPAVDTVVVNAFRPVDHLAFNVVDAEYSDALESIIMISSQPLNYLHIYDPLLETAVTVNLAYEPTCVSVAPDGLTAAVGQEGYVSIVDLQAASVLVTHPVGARVRDIVLADYGFAYVIPQVSGSSSSSIRSLNITTGQYPLGGTYFSSGAGMRLHPSGGALYAADYNNIRRFDITSGVAVSVSGSYNNSSQAPCRRLWMSEDGYRIYGGCGRVFRASAAPAEDGTFNGSFSISSNWLSSVANSSDVGLVAALIDGESFSFMPDNIIYFYDDSTFTPAGETVLPKLIIDGVAAESHGRFVFYNSNGSKLFVILRAPAENRVFDFGIVTY